MNKSIVIGFAKIYLLFIAINSFSCDDNGDKLIEKESGLQDVAANPDKDAEIQSINLEQKKRLAGERFPCDTLSLAEFVLRNYPEGTYLVESDKTTTYNIPRSAVVYLESNYILGLIAKSKEGERLIETKNIVGYDQSFIDLDSTELGTAFFYLTLFECDGTNIKAVWESPIPSHGGFNNLTLHKWKFQNMFYAKVNFHYAQGTGHIDYNYFFADGIENEPHLLMTYEGINFRRTIANLNGDRFPDYYEYLYYDLEDRVFSKDSIGFVWDSVKNAYINTRNNKQTRQY